MRSVAGLVLAALAACGAPSPADAAVRRFVDVSEKCPRYFETADGKTWIPVGINLCYAHPDETTAVDAPDAMVRMERWMRNFAAAGGNYIRLFLCRSTVEVLTDRVGVYDERGAANLKRLVALAEELNLKVKLTLECFRTVKPANEVTGEHQVKCNKPLYAPFAGSTMHGFFTSPKCREIFMGKVKYLKSLGLGDSSAVIDWEPFNEINSCGDCADWMPWSESVLAEMQALFPRQMVTQNMGSFSGPDGWKRYSILADTPASAFMQVHRYLDPGAQLRVCRGPMDILCADAIREMRDRRLDRPVLLAETGGVEAHHVRYTKVYDTDRKGMLLHDAIFAPFFAGAAGCGCMWHWGQMYIDRWNLWYHYARFAEAIRGVDPVKEDFLPLRFETTLRRGYALVGRETTLVWLRDEANTWETECIRGIEPKELRGERLPFASDATVDWYMPFEDRHVTTPKGPVDVPRHARSIVGRFPTPKNLRTYVPSLKDN